VGTLSRLFLTDGGTICQRQAADRPFRARNINILVFPSSRIWQLNHPSAGILNLLSIACAHRLRLRTRLTLGGRPLPRKPWAYGGRDSCPAYRYSCLHSHLRSLDPGLRRSFTVTQRSPTKPFPGGNGIQSFGIPVIANHFRREITR
jgi:hypothetical protein